MTWGELKERMAGRPDDFPILLSSDEEGNEKRDLYGIDFSKAVEYDYEWETIHPDDFDPTAWEGEKHQPVDVAVFW